MSLEAPPTRTPRYPRPHPLAWPEPPEGLVAFSLLMWTPKPRPVGQSIEPLRLRNLTTTQLRWVAETVMVEIGRREAGAQDRPAEEP